MFRAAVLAATVIKRYQIFGLANMADFGHKWVRVLGSGLHTTTQHFWEYPLPPWEMLRHLYLANYANI